MRSPDGDDAAAAPIGPALSEAESEPWRGITVGVAGPEFEARPPRQYAFDVPDTECDGWSTPDLTLRFASVRGANHRYYRQPRQDAARAALHESTGAVAFAVADGVSSASNAEIGAIEACRAAVHRMLHLLSLDKRPLDFRDVAHHAAERLGQLARWRLNGRQPEATEVADLYATTLVAGVVRPDPAGPLVELCRIGDSGAWILDRSDTSDESSESIRSGEATGSSRSGEATGSSRSGEATGSIRSGEATGSSGRYEPLFDSKTGSDTLLISNEVAPLPYVPMRLQHTGGRLTAGRVLLVGTDGFGDPLGDGDGRVGALFARTLAQPPSPAWLAHVLDFSRETFDDDRSLLVVWPHATPGVR
ncbi:protein phosphatase 2C domain-containing protein [Streptomyces sp. SID3343]|uniref:protein phosphatase 2C domain-containing protein n=1 Tax=Streptomyces sp. SID3343 TaxID=2690260 RepID=UPI001371418E|nr:protein phosphatase 2C domain-containing protein [Streptomyces sp. SID3343]MYW05774.1 hypothetical protein [Streptomyces sp. SID3343]